MVVGVLDSATSGIATPWTEAHVEITEAVVAHLSLPSAAAPRAASIAAANWDPIVGITCWWVSIVNAALLCPRASLATFGWMPDSSSALPNGCRRLRARSRNGLRGSAQ